MERLNISAFGAILAFFFLFAISGAVQGPRTTLTLAQATLFSGAPAPAKEETSVDRSIIDRIRAEREQAAAEEAARQERLEKYPITGETLWLARVIYSETKRPYEQEVVAWVVRNRVETGFRGRRTYRAVVLDPWQFSAFNPGPKRRHYSNLNQNSTARGWQTALQIAHDVQHADESQRPFSLTTRHFYSEISMVGRRHPAWARGQRPVAIDRDVRIDPRRFRFFENIS
jgi:hypothetical protein